MSDNDSADELTGAQALVRSLERVGAEVVFGIPGGAILPLYDPLFDSAEGPAHPRPPRAGRRPRGRGLRDGDRQGRRLHGHLGPGRDQPGHPDRRRATWTRCRSSRSPDRWRSPAIGTDAFQEADIRGITMPITKHNFLGHQGRRHSRGDRQRVPHRRHGPPRPGARRRHQGRAAGPVALRLAAPARSAGLPPGDQAARQAGPRGAPG